MPIVWCIAKQFQEQGIATSLNGIEVGTFIIIVVCALIVFGVSDALTRGRKRHQKILSILDEVEVDSELDRAAEALQDGNPRLCYYICNKILHEQKHWRAYQIRGMACLRENDEEGALDDFRMSLKLEPDWEKNKTSYQMRAMLVERRFLD